MKSHSATLSVGGPSGQTSLDPALLAYLETAIIADLQDPQVGAIYFRGQPGMFLAGADLKFFADAIQSHCIHELLDFTRRAHLLLQAIERAPKPVIAVVEGPAYGAGLELALACSRVEASATAKFSFPETGLGIYPGMGGTQRTGRRIGTGLAKWMIYTGAIVPADAAIQIGLIDATHPPIDPAPPSSTTPTIDGNFVDRHERMRQLFERHSIDQLCDEQFPLPGDPHLARAVVQVRRKPRRALQLAEHLIDAGGQLPLDDALELEFSYLRDALSSDDARSLIGSFVRAREGS